MNRRYILTHRSLFLLGWAYYILTPLALGYAGVFETASSLNLLGQYFEEKNSSWPYLVMFSFLAPTAYLLGSYWTPIREVGESILAADQKRGGGRILVPIYTLMLGVLTLEARPLLGAGYMGDLDISLLGPLATMHMLILFQYLYERSAGHRAATAFGALLILSSIFLLSMGGRLYVLAGLVAVYVRWWNVSAPSRSTQLKSLGLILGVPIALIYIGMWRVGETNYSLIGFYLVAESTFTSISAFTLFTGDQWSSLVEIPYDFLVAFANIVPSKIWPGKAEWLAATTTTNQTYESPFGAVNIIASAVSNFGLFGGIVFFLFVGAYMTHVSRARGKAAREAYLYYLVGLLPFMFFRDPFQVQVKVVMTGMLLYWLTVFFQGTATKSRVPRSSSPASETHPDPRPSDA